MNKDKLILTAILILIALIFAPNFYSKVKSVLEQSVNQKQIEVKLTVRK